MKTSELHDRLGCPNNTLHRLAERGILRPTRITSVGGSHRWGYAFDWNEEEQRAAAACVRLLLSGLLEMGRKSATASEARDDCLRAVAEAARAPFPTTGAPRWIMLRADGACIRAGDLLAAAATGHRTLVPLAL